MHFLIAALRQLPRRAVSMRRFGLRENIKLLERQLLSARKELATLERLWKVSCPDLRIPNALGENEEDTLDRAVRVNGAYFGSLQIWNRQSQALRRAHHVRLSVNR